MFLEVTVLATSIREPTGLDVSEHRTLVNLRVAKWTSGPHLWVADLLRIFYRKQPLCFYPTPVYAHTGAAGWRFLSRE